MVQSAKNSHVLILVVLLILFNILVLSNILQSDYFGDDLYNFQIPGLIPFEYQNISEYTLKSIQGWMANGRLFPASSYHAYLFGLFENSILAYKIFMLFLVLLNIVLFSYLVYIISKSKSLSLSVLLVTSLMFQYRYYHDPMLSFHGLMQVLFLHLTLSLVFLKQYLKTKRFIYYIFSLGFFTLSLLTYEIAYTFILFYIPIIYSERREGVSILKNLKTLSPYFFILLTLVLYTLYLRSLASIVSGPYLPSWDILAIIKTYYYQVMSVLPGTYYFNFGHDINLTDSLDLVFFICIFLLVLVFSGQHLAGKDTVLMPKQLVLMAILLLLLPGLLTSLSTKFQGLSGVDMNSVQFGVAYIPIYLQTFGLSLLVSIFINKVSSIKHSFFILLILASIFTIHYSSNNQVVQKVNIPYKDSREILTMFFSGEFNERLQSKDIIFFERDSLLHSKAFISMVTNKNIYIQTNKKKKYTYTVNYEVNSKEAIVSVKDGNNEQVLTSTYINKNNSWVESNKNKSKGVFSIFNNFYDWEGGPKGMRWSMLNPSITLINSHNFNKFGRLTFKIKSLNDRKVEIILNGKLIDSFDLDSSLYVFDHALNLKPGENTLEIISKEPPVNPLGPDNRLLLLSIEEYYFNISKE